MILNQQTMYLSILRHQHWQCLLYFHALMSDTVDSSFRKIYKVARKVPWVALHRFFGQSQPFISKILNPIKSKSWKQIKET